MNIQILDSFLREHLKTKATPKQIAELLSLSSVSVERLEKYKDDYLYDIEVTTNRPDLMSAVGLARETATVLKHNKIDAEFIPVKIAEPTNIKKLESVNIKNNPELVKRICAVVMEVQIKDSPQKIKDRLESSGIRSLNNLVDITNYVMRIIGHPTHVFDFDLIPTKTLEIRESRSGEKIQTLDGKSHELKGGDIVADDGLGHIIDLLGVMGLENSSSNNNTKRILFFVNNNNPEKIRKTSMTHGIRTEAAILNEKGISSNYARDALLYGIKLYEELADGKVISDLIDINNKKSETKSITVSLLKINSVIGINIPAKTSIQILKDLEFEVKEDSEKLTVTPPHFREKDIENEEDIIEEIARIYGYHNIPNKLPNIHSGEILSLEESEFYFEDHIRDALRYWGLNEVYTYPMVSENLYEGDLSDAVTIKNPLNEEFVYMRKTLIPSLLKVAKENKTHENISIFEIANIYEKNGDNLPKEILKLAGIIKKKKLSFYKVKGLVEQLLIDLGIKKIDFKKSAEGMGADIYIDKEMIGYIEILDTETIDFEIDFEKILKYATLKKTYKPVSKFPPVIEDLSIIAPEDISTGSLIDTIKNQSELVSKVTLLDKYQNTRTFHIIYQSDKRNMTIKEVGELREKILKELKSKHNASLKKQ